MSLENYYERKITSANTRKKALKLEEKKTVTNKQSMTPENYYWHRNTSTDTK